VTIAFDEGDLRILELVGNARGVALLPPAAEESADQVEAWRRMTHEALAAELVAHGISDVIVNGYGLQLERLIDTIADSRGAV